MLIDARISQGVAKAACQGSGRMLPQEHSERRHDIVALEYAIESLPFIAPAPPRVAAIEQIQRCVRRDAGDGLMQNPRGRAFGGLAYRQDPVVQPPRQHGKKRTARSEA